MEGNLQLNIHVHHLDNMYSHIAPTHAYATCLYNIAQMDRLVAYLKPRRNLWPSPRRPVTSIHNVSK
jgi:hypothetical protein